MKFAFHINGDFLRWFSICGGGQNPSIRTRRFSGSWKPKSQNPIHSKNEALRWARLWIEFCSIRKAVFHPDFLLLATVSKLKIRTAEICPLFFSTNFQVLPLGQKLVFSETGQMSAKTQSYPQRKNAVSFTCSKVLKVQGAETPYFYGLKKL